MDETKLLESLRQIVREEIENNNKALIAGIDEKLKANNVAIGEIITEVAERSEEKIINAVRAINDEFKPVIAQNCIDITKLRSKA